MEFDAKLTYIENNLAEESRLSCAILFLQALTLRPQNAPADLVAERSRIFSFEVQ